MIEVDPHALSDGQSDEVTRIVNNELLIRRTEFEGREIRVGDIVTIRKRMRPVSRDRTTGLISPLDLQQALDSLVKAGWEIVSVEVPER